MGSNSITICSLVVVCNVIVATVNNSMMKAKVAHSSHVRSFYIIMILSYHRYYKYV